MYGVAWLKIPRCVVTSVTESDVLHISLLEHLRFVHNWNSCLILAQRQCN